MNFYDEGKVSITINSDKINFSKNVNKLISLSKLKNFAPIETWSVNGTNKELSYLTHGIFRYFGKFPPPVATHLINTYTKQNSLVFDPMCGSGTTGIESIINNRKSILNDVSPLSTLITEVKTTKLSEKKIYASFNKIKNAYKPSDFKNSNFQLLGLRDTDHWFLAETLDSLYGLKILIDQEKNAQIKKFLTVCFLSIVRKVSKATTQQGRLFLDVKSAKKDAFEFFEKKVISGINSFDLFPTKYHKPQITSLDIRDNISLIFNEGTDLIICHPPYFNSYKYSRINTLELAWMGHESAKIRPNEVKEFFKIGKKENAEIYINDMVTALRSLNKVMKKGSHLALMIGDTKIKGDYVNITSNLLSKISNIYEIQKIAIREPKYTEASWVSSQRRNKDSLGVTLHDFIIILKKI